MNKSYPELMRDIAIYKNHVAFWGSPLSNFYSCEFTFDNTVWKSSEQCFMAMKAKFFKDKETYNQILEAKTPKEAKRLGRLVKNFNNDLWDNEKDSIMFKILKEKFTQNDDLHDLLLNSKFMNKGFVEGSPFDGIWGVKISWDNPSIDNKSSWKGENRLGKTLDKVRQYIINSEKTDKKD